MREFAITPPRASVLMVVVLIGCGDSSGPESTLDPNVPPITQGNWYRPGVNATYVDFAVNEQCHEFDECVDLQPFVLAGKPVFNAEHDNQSVTDAAERDRVCAAARAQDIRTLILPLDLDDAFRFSCDV